MLTSHGGTQDAVSAFFVCAECCTRCARVQPPIYVLNDMVSAGGRRQWNGANRGVGALLKVGGVHIMDPGGTLDGREVGTNREHRNGDVYTMGGILKSKAS